VKRQTKICRSSAVQLQVANYAAREQALQKYLQDMPLPLHNFKNDVSTVEIVDGGVSVLTKSNDRRIRKARSQIG
jgi:hypothetical protein